MSKQCKICKARKYCSYADETIRVIDCFNKDEQEEMVSKVRADEREKIARQIRNVFDRYTPSYTDIYNIITELQDEVLEQIKEKEE